MWISCLSCVLVFFSVLQLPSRPDQVPSLPSLIPAQLKCGSLAWVVRHLSRMTYKSPSKTVRSKIRMTLFLLAKSRSAKPTSITSNPKLSFYPKSKCLTRSKVTLTNYPAACELCHNHQCHYDESHCLGYIFACAQYLNNALDSMLANPLSDALKKPPDK